MEPKRLVLWLKGDSEANSELAEAAGFSEIATEYVAGALHEVKVTLLVNPENGHYAVESWEEM